MPSQACLGLVTVGLAATGLAAWAQDTWRPSALGRHEEILPYPLRKTEKRDICREKTHSSRKETELDKIKRIGKRDQRN